MFNIFLDCSGCITGGYNCSPECYSYGCGGRNCGFESQNNFCGQHGGEGCGTGDGCFADAGCNSKAEDSSTVTGEELNEEESVTN